MTPRAGWLLVVALVGCQAPEPSIEAHGGPIILITIDAFRADTVGALGGVPGLTPNLDAFIEESDWAGRAISTSSWTVPSMASIFTGLQPWRHGNWHGDRALLQEDLTTVSEALKEIGYSTAAFRSNRWLTRQFGYGQGFDQMGSIDKFGKVERHLAGLDGGREFVWLHLLPPHAPYLYQEWLRPRLTDPREDLPARIKPPDLEPFFDPAIPMPEDDRERAWQLYQMNVARSDSMLGKILEAIRESGQWDRSLIVVTSDHGEEFGEADQVLHGGNLHRVLIEVPLAVKLPDGIPGDRLVAASEVVSNARVFATLVEAAGGAVAPDVAPSLFTASEQGALSELYLGNGINTVSHLVGDRQTVWRSEFATPERDYYRARLEATGAGDQGLEEEPGEILSRLADAFQLSPPLRGVPEHEPRVDAWLWREGGVVSAEIDSAAVRRLRDRWLELNGEDVPPALLDPVAVPELSPEDLERLRALGYVAGGGDS